MELSRQSLKIVRCSEARIKLGHISNPVPVIWVAVLGRRTTIVLIYRTDPNLGEAEISKISEEINVTYLQ